MFTLLMRKLKTLSIKQLCNKHSFPLHTIFLELKQPGRGKKNTKQENILEEVKEKDIQTYSATFKGDSS